MKSLMDLRQKNSTVVVKKRVLAVKLNVAILRKAEIKIENQWRQQSKLVFINKIDY